MGTFPQKKATKGSQKWLQIVVNETPELLSGPIKSSFGLSPNLEIEWLSPIETNDFAEYRDEEFLEKLGIAGLDTPLTQFWPKGGPQWDALGRVSEKGPYFLVEAKANIPEIISSCQAESAESLMLIEKSLQTVQNYLGCEPLVNWSAGFYQYANRIAHLYFLRTINSKEAFLVFIYFLNDTTHIPINKQSWRGALNLQKRLMGLTKHKLQKFIAEIFIDTIQIKGQRASGLEI